MSKSIERDVVEEHRDMLEELADTDLRCAKYAELLLEEA